ncbi:MAG TPA: glycerophosphodiester phosphodiesterase [Acidimicrobiales bacterium]|nr:glycerophosphodiester phosphodiesterase [Acidimicrobiales bacterium]
MNRTWPFLDHPGPIPFAHRGGASEWPENTMAAFEHAVGLGYRYLETDVHVTVDGVLVAFHDDVLDRVTDRRGRIDTLPWSEVRQARVDGQGIPLLEELLGTWPEARVNIDPKHDASVGPLVDVIDRTGAHDRVCVAAFSDRRLARVRQLTAGRVCTGTGPVEVARLRAAGYRVPCGRIAAACVQVPLRWQRMSVVDRRFLDAAHRRSLPVHVWTVDEPAEIERLLDLGVDGIMTDRPAVLKEVLQRRGQWVG